MPTFCGSEQIEYVLELGDAVGLETPDEIRQFAADRGFEFDELSLLSVGEADELADQLIAESQV